MPGFERKWPAVPPIAFTVDGGQWGLVTVANTAGFRVKQNAYLTATGLPNLPVQVKLVLSPTTLVVGYIDNQIANWPRLNISAYTVAGAATIGAEYQDKNKITNEDIQKAVYEADPVVALRTTSVDEYGQFYTAENPLPVNASVVVPPGTIPTDWTEIDLSYDSNNNLIQVIFVLPAPEPNVELELTYDSNNNLTKVVAS